MSVVKAALLFQMYEIIRLTLDTLSTRFTLVSDKQKFAHVQYKFRRRVLLM